MGKIKSQTEKRYSKIGRGKQESNELSDYPSRNRGKVKLLSCNFSNVYF